jgi:hypothetical protein
MLPIEKTKELTEAILDDREMARLAQMRKYILDFAADAEGEC